jgi:RecJ-like exonuclease
MSSACDFCGGTRVHPQYSLLSCPRCSPSRLAKRFSKAGDKKEPSEDKQDTQIEDPDDNQILCPLCGGDGENADGEACQRCDGEGVIDNPNEDAGEPEDSDKEVKGTAMLEALSAWDAEVQRRMRRFDESLATASLKVGQQRPDLYQACVDEKEDAANSGSRRRKAYREALTARFAAGGIGTTHRVHTSTLPSR